MFHLGLRFLRDLPKRTLEAVQQHPGVTLALGLNIALLLLPFYDSNNLGLAISFVSHFDSHTKALSITNWVGGPVMDAAWVPAYIVYIASGSSVVATYTFFKVLNLVLLSALAYTLASVLPSKNHRVREAIAVFTLANPIWLYVNYIWVEWDIFPVTFLTIGYVLLRYNSVNRTNFTTFLSAGAIVLGTLFYWFPAIAVPTLLYYSRTNKERARLLVYVGSLGTLGLLVLFGLMGASSSVYTGTLLTSGSVLNRSGDFGLQYFIHLTFVEYVTLTAFIAFILPFTLKLMGVSEPATIFAVITLLVYTAIVPMPDNYAIIFPFALLALASPAVKKVPWKRLWLALAYPLTGLFLINFFISNAQPDGVGIFYFGYTLFGQNVQFLSTPSAQTLYLYIFNLVTTVAVASSLVVVILSSRQRIERFSNQPVQTARFKGSKGDFWTWHRSQEGRGNAIKAAILIVVLAVSAFGFNSILPDVIHYNGVGDPPIYTFLPLFIPDNGNVVRPIPGDTYTTSGSTVHILKNAPAFQFSRWFNGQGVNLGATETLGGAIPRYTPLVTGSPFSVTYLNLTGPNVSASIPLNWTSATNVTMVHSIPLPLEQGGRLDEYFNGNATAIYGFQASTFVNHYYTFAYDLARIDTAGTNIVHIDTNGGFVAVVLYPSLALLVYASAALTGGKLIAVPFGPVPPTQDLGYVILHPTFRSLWVDISGSTAQVPNIISRNKGVIVRFGVPFEPNGSQFALSGNVTPLYTSAGNLTIEGRGTIEVNNPQSTTFLDESSPTLNFSLDSGSSASYLTVNGRSFESAGPTTSFGIGKYVSMDYTVNITVNRIWVTQFASNNYALVPVFAFTVVPYLFLPVAISAMSSRNRMRQYVIQRTRSDIGVQRDEEVYPTGLSEPMPGSTRRVE